MNNIAKTLFKSGDRGRNAAPTPTSPQAAANGAGSSNQPNATGTINRFKSAADSVAAKSSKEKVGWRPPLQRHLDTNRVVQFVTIRVRVLDGDTEHDFHARFEPGQLTAESVCDAIAERQGLAPEQSRLFSLWVVSKDLELQIRPKQDIFGLMIFWNKWMMKYTHFPEAENPMHPINRHWFVYRREASISIVEEMAERGEDAVIRLLYGEAKRNVLTKRWICSVGDAASLAAIQLQLSNGDYSPERFPAGYLIQDHRYEQILPAGMGNKLRPVQWEEAITARYIFYTRLGPEESRHAFLDVVRRWPCYGCSFFPACIELPPSGFFEYRTQNLFIGLNYAGVVVVDYDQNRYIYAFPWGMVEWRATKDLFIMIITKETRIKQVPLITPQAPVIDNLALRLKHRWEKGSMTINLLKRPMSPRAMKAMTSPTSARQPNQTQAAHQSMVPGSSRQAATADKKGHEFQNLEDTILQDYLAKQTKNQNQTQIPVIQNGSNSRASMMPVGSLNANAVGETGRFNTTLNDVNKANPVQGSGVNRAVVPQTNQYAQATPAHRQATVVPEPKPLDANQKAKASRDEVTTSQGSLLGGWGSGMTSRLGKTSATIKKSFGSLSSLGKNSKSIEALASATVTAFKTIVGDNDANRANVVRNPDIHYKMSAKDSYGMIDNSSLPAGFSKDGLSIRPGGSVGSSLSIGRPNGVTPSLDSARAAPAVASGSRLNKKSTEVIAMEMPSSQASLRMSPKQNRASQQQLARQTYTGGIEGMQQNARNQEKYRSSAEDMLLAELDALDKGTSACKDKAATGKSQPLASDLQSGKKKDGMSASIMNLKDEFDDLDNFVSNMHVQVGMGSNPQGGIQHQQSTSYGLDGAPQRVASRVVRKSSILGGNKSVANKANLEPQSESKQLKSDQRVYGSEADLVVGLPGKPLATAGDGHVFVTMSSPEGGASRQMTSGHRQSHSQPTSQEIQMMGRESVSSQYNYSGDHRRVSTTSIQSNRTSVAVRPRVETTVSSVIQTLMAPQELRSRSEVAFDYDENITGLGPAVVVDIKRKPTTVQAKTKQGP